MMNWAAGEGCLDDLSQGGWRPAAAWLGKTKKDARGQCTAPSAASPALQTLANHNAHPPFPSTPSSSTPWQAGEVGDSVRIMVGVTSACCSPKARARRDAVRRTWIKRTRALHPEVDVVFFLSQPENASVAAKARGPIAVSANNGNCCGMRRGKGCTHLPGERGAAQGCHGPRVLRAVIVAADALCVT